LQNTDQFRKCQVYLDSNQIGLGKKNKGARGKKGKRLATLFLERGEKGGKLRRETSMLAGFKGSGQRTELKKKTQEHNQRRTLRYSGGVEKESLRKKTNSWIKNVRAKVEPERSEQTGVQFYKRKEK